MNDSPKNQVRLKTAASAVYWHNCSQIIFSSTHCFRGRATTPWRRGWRRSPPAVCRNLTGGLLRSIFTVGFGLCSIFAGLRGGYNIAKLPSIGPHIEYGRSHMVYPPHLINANYQYFIIKLLLLSVSGL